ncbi:hypothetical protein JCM11491_000903 [Sporobolomyces phaffii]
MPRSNSTSPVKPGPSSSRPSPPSAPTRRKRARAVVESSSDDDDDIEILDDDGDGPRDKTLPAKTSDAPVIDLTLDDDDDDGQLMPPPPVPTRKQGIEDNREKDPPKRKLDKGKRVERSGDPDSSAAAASSEMTMWIDEFTPTCRQDLAIHAKKVTDVANWFDEAFPSSGVATKLSQKYRRLLVLSGPAGSGKTACLTTLARERGVQVLEWTEDANVSNANDDYRESMVGRFTSFLARAGMTPSLDFVDSPSSSTSFSSASAVASSSSNLLPLSPDPRNRDVRRLILLEDLPNVSHYPTKLALRSALLQYLSSPRVTCPLVLIVSEALARPGVSDGSVEAGAGGWSRNADSLDSRSVCGVQVLQHPACREISFNPIAQTIMKKALNRILDQVHDSSSSSTLTTLDHKSRPSGPTLDLIIQHSNGDLRSAVMSLQFLSTRASNSSVTTSLGGGGGGGGAKGKGKAKKVKTDRASRRDDAKELLQVVTSRENSLFIFHALGKVLYNKRWGESPADDKKDLNRPGIVQPSGDAVDKLPKHLRKEWSRTPSKVDPDVVFAEAPIDSDVFLLYLHHNFPQFTSQSIESCSTILDSLSEADALSRLDDGQTKSGLTSLYSFGVAVRGTLLGLPSPVERDKQVLRKSEWWDMDRARALNVEGVGELVAASLRPDGGTERDEGVGTWRRDRKSLLTELIPWCTLVNPSRTNPFLLDLATFPPLVSNQPSSSLSVSGEALGEKDVKLEDDHDHEAYSLEGALASERGVSRRLEEVDVEGEDGPGSEVHAGSGEAMQAPRDGWYEEEDDIVDDD